MKSMSITEFQAVKSLRCHIQSKRHDADTKHEDQEMTDADYALYKALDIDENISTSDNQKAWLDLNYGPSFFNSYEYSRIKSGFLDLSSSMEFVFRLRIS